MVALTVHIPTLYKMARHLMEFQCSVTRCLLAELVETIPWMHNELT